MLLALINLRGVGESVKFNVVLTMVEVTALAIVIGIGFYVMVTKGADPGQLVVFDSATDRGLFAATTVATAIAFFAMVGFEDSVNMVEEVQDPERIFPRALLTGLGVAALIYVLVAVSVIVVIPLGEIQSFEGETGILIEVVKQGAPGFPVSKVFPFLTVFAVANTALINMLMASRLIYGLAQQDVLPRSLGKVSTNRRAPWAGIAFTTLLALGLITVVTLDSDSSVVVALSGTTALLLLVVFTIVNVACLVARRRSTRDPGLPGADGGPGARRDRLCLPGRAVGARSGELHPVPHRGRAARDRHRAVGADLGDQPWRAGQEDRLPGRGLAQRLILTPAA